MKSRHSKLRGSLRPGAALLLTICLSVFTLILVGCPERENDTVSGIASPQAAGGDPAETGGAMMPTIDELVDLLSLTEAQIPSMATALDELNLAREARREMRGNRGNSERGPGGGHPGGGHPGSGHPGGGPGGACGDASGGGRPGGACGGAPGGGRPCDGDQSAEAGERTASPVHQFMMSCCEFLSLEQRGALISLIAEHRDTAMTARENGGEGRPGHGGNLEALDLTDEQQRAIETVRTEMREQMKSLRQEAGSGGMTDALREQIKALHETMKNRIQEILTQEQREQQAQLQAQIQAQRDQRRLAQLTRRLEQVGSGGERRLAHLTTVLDLTADQVGQVEAIQATAQQQQTALIQGQIDGTLTREEIQTRREQISEQTVAQIRAVLTEEQAELFDLLSEFFKSPREFSRSGCN